jgi:hypothetical protein
VPKLRRIAIVAIEVANIPLFFLIRTGGVRLKLLGIASVGGVALALLDVTSAGGVLDRTGVGGESLGLGLFDSIVVVDGGVEGELLTIF